MRCLSPGLAASERQFSERDRDVLDLVRPVLEAALRDAQARERLVLALATEPPPGTAVVLLDRYGEIEHASLDAERWLAEHFGAAEHAGWLPEAVAAWLALPPRPPLVSVRDGRRLTVHLLPGDPHALLLEEEVASFRPEALDRLGLTPRETEVLRAAAAIEEEADIAWELCLSLHAVRDRLAHLEAKLGVHTAADAVTVRSARARRQPACGPHAPSLVPEVLRGDPSPRYRVRWDDGHESIYTPASGALRAEQRPKRQRRAAPSKRSPT